MSETTIESKYNFSFAGIVWLAFLVLVVSLGFMQPFVFVALQRISPSDLIFPFVAVLWLIGVLFRRSSIRWHRSYWFMAAYFVAMVLSSVFSVDPRSSYVKLIGEAYLLGLAVLTFNLVDSESRIKQTVLAWAFGTMGPVLIAFVTIALFYLQPENWLLAYTTYHFGAVPVINFPRVSSTFVSASMFCNYLNVGVVLAFAARDKRWIGPYLFAVLLALIVIAALATISIGIGGIFLAIGICLWITKRSANRRLAIWALFGGIIIAAAFFASSFVALKPHATAPFAVNVPIVGVTLYPSSRTMVWMGSWATFEDNFVVGKGLNQPVCAVSFQNTDGSYSLLSDAHNIYLSVAAQNGVVGLIAIVALSLFLLRLGYRSSDMVTRLMAAAFLTTFVYQGLTGAYEDARHLWVLIGLLLAASKLGSGPE